VAHLHLESHSRERIVVDSFPPQPSTLLLIHSNSEEEVVWTLHSRRKRYLTIYLEVVVVQVVLFSPHSQRRTSNLRFPVPGSLLVLHLTP